MPETFAALTQPGQLDDCGCGDALATRTPVAIRNRAGLSAIAYRVGTHALFKQSMQARLSAAGLPALAGLRTRADDDFAMALLDAWAMVADVLTFYQERIANESYLRTAVERLSLLELARLIGYELRPGVAASAYLAFTLETAPGAPSRVALAPGVRTQSVPGPGEQPATFETIEAIEARPAWNALKVRTAFLPDLTALASPLYLAGTANNVRKGDALLLAATADGVLTEGTRGVARYQVADVARAITTLNLTDDATSATTTRFHITDIARAIDPRYFVTDTARGITALYRVTGVTVDTTRQVTRVDVVAENVEQAGATTAAWSPWSRINSGVFAQTTSIAAVARYPDHLDLFCVGLDRGAYGTWWDWNGWAPGWYRVEDPGHVFDVFTSGTPFAALARYPTHLDLFAVGQDGKVYNPYWDQSDGVWHTANPIFQQTFPARTPIAAVSRYPAHWDLVGVGTDGSVYTASYGDDTGSADWSPISNGTFTQLTPIAAVSRYPQHLDLFGVGKDGGVYSAWWDVSTDWSDWFRIGSGVFTQLTPIAALARYPGHLDLFAVGQDGRVWSAWWDVNTGWNDWFPVGTGTFAQNTPVTAIARHPDHLDLFGVGLDGGVYSAWWDATAGWTDWSRVGAAAFAQFTPITAIARSATHVDLFGVGPDGGVHSTCMDVVENTAAWNPAPLAAPEPMLTPPSATVDPHQIAWLYQTPRPLTDHAIWRVLFHQVWHGGDLEAFARAQGWSLADALATVATVFDRDPDAAPERGIFAFRARASLFGHSAPNWQTLPDSVRNHYADSHLAGSYFDWPFPTFGHDLPPPNQLDLDMVYSQITPGGWVVAQRYHDLTNQPRVSIAAHVLANVETGVADFTMSAKVSRLQLAPFVASANAAPATMSDVRETTLYAQSEKLTRAGVPISAPLAGSAIDLDGLYDGLSAGQAIAISGARADLPGTRASEVAVIADVIHDLRPGGVTWLRLAVDLAYRYDRATVSINANVALATHGETKQEPLGSGDASQSYQRFTLSQSPLTYIGASTPSGTESTLAVRVNNVLWHEVPALYGQGPRDRVFVTHTGDDGTTTVEFGDGHTGARLPTGQENIQATYREGIGLAGQVKAGQIKLLLSHPLGVKSVVNPQDAAGAADPQSRDDARQAAPLTVLTLDRIVSLEDYQDFAQAYAGIAKALATWTWDGQTRGVFVTVAGPEGARVDEGGILYTHLLEAMRQAAEPYIDLRVRSYRPAFFRLGADVKVDPDYRQDDVLARVEGALRARFAFAARTFGQGVALSEVVAAMQAVAGVVAVDLDRLYRSDQSPALNNLLTAAAPQAGAAATADGAELLTLDPAPLDHLGVMA